MLERRLTLVNELGLHARAAARLVRLAATFDSEIVLKRIDTGVEANARSILDILYLSASKGREVAITFTGADENDAALAIENMFIDGFGEL